MSFGFAIGDFVAVGNLALRVYRACKGAAGQFNEVVREVTAVSIVVRDLEDQAACPDSLLNRWGSHKSSELKSIIDNIAVALQELEGLATRYASLNSMQRKKWDTIRFASKDITDIRARLSLHIQAAQAILDGIHGTSLAHIQLQNDESKNTLGRLEFETAVTHQGLARIEQLLADKIQEVKQGSREPSTISGDGWNIWAEIRRDLQIEGFSSELVKLYKVEIKSYLVSLVNSAGLQSHIPTDGEEDTDPFEDTDDTHHMTNGEKEDDSGNIEDRDQMKDTGDKDAEPTAFINGIDSGRLSPWNSGLSRQQIVFERLENAITAVVH